MIIPIYCAIVETPFSEWFPLVYSTCMCVCVCQERAVGFPPGLLLAPLGFQGRHSHTVSPACRPFQYTILCSFAFISPKPGLLHTRSCHLTVMDKLRFYGPWIIQLSSSLQIYLLSRYSTIARIKLVSSIIDNLFH